LGENKGKQLLLQILDARKNDDTVRFLKIMDSLQTKDLLNMGNVMVEACYELLGCNVWGKIVSGSTHYDISYSDTYRDEHNETHEFDIVEWEENLYPATQCGHESGEKGTSWNTMFTSEPYLYEPNF